jgi:DNA-binding MarR family transcriptional regulator
VADHAASRIVRASLERFVAASARQRAALAKLLGLLDSDVVALEHVLRAGELSAVALARRMPLSSGGTAAVIDRLCTAGLISRTRDPRDRRRVVLRATPGVEQRLGELLAPLAADIDAATGELSAAQRALVSASWRASPTSASATPIACSRQPRPLPALALKCRRRCCGASRRREAIVQDRQGAG